MRRPDPITRNLRPDMWGRNSAPLNDVPLFDQSPDQMGSQMAAMTPTQGPAMPEQFERKPGAFGKGGIGWAILGSLGDALSAYGGQKGVFAPAMQDMAARKAQEDQFREKLAMEHQYRMAELAAKGQELSPMERDLQVWQRWSPEQKAEFAQFNDVRNPIAVSGPQGTFRVPRSYTGGNEPPSKTLADGTRAWWVNGDWYDNPEGR